MESYKRRRIDNLPRFEQLPVDTSFISALAKELTKELAPLLGELVTSIERVEINIQQQRYAIEKLQSEIRDLQIHALHGDLC